MSSRFFVVLTTAASFAAPSCGSPSDPTPLALSKSLATAHYVFHYSEGDSVNSAWLEEYHAWAAAALRPLARVLVRQSGASRVVQRGARGGAPDQSSRR